MSKKTTNVFVPHRYGNSLDYDKILATLDRANIKTSDRSVPQDSQLTSKGNHLTHQIYNKIDTASAVIVPARPSSTKEGSFTRKEIDYALSQGKKVIAVDTGSTKNTSTYFKNNNIPIIPNRKDSIKNAVEN
jgi:hypothetical protein